MNVTTLDFYAIEADSVKQDTFTGDLYVNTRDIIRAPFVVEDLLLAIANDFDCAHCPVCDHEIGWFLVEDDYDGRVREVTGFGEFSIVYDPRTDTAWPICNDCDIPVLDPIPYPVKEDV